MKPFTGEWAFLSNFDQKGFWLDGKRMKSAEHAFNAAKTQNPEKQAWVLAAASPAEAKSRGRKVPLRPGWDQGIRVATMRDILKEKFFAGGDYAERLIATGHEPLVELNCWHDQFWGDCTCGEGNCYMDGVNMLGELLMALRATLARNDVPW